MDSEGNPQILVLQVYRSVWEEYSEWSNNCRASTLKSLAAPHPQLHSQSDFEEPDSVEACPAAEDDDLQFLVSEFNVDGLTTNEYLISGKSITVDQDFRPYPPYESCTPISRNLMVGDDSDYLPFIPFADDPKYDFRLDVEEHKYFRWHRPFLDPDAEVVACETVERLVKDHGMTPEDIDRAAVLPLSYVNLIKLHKKRDFPKWPIKKPTFECTNSPEQIIPYFLATFCNNLNCITGFCTTHLETQTPNFVPPKVPYPKLGDNIARPCGVHCFLHPTMNSTSISSATIWTDKDTLTLFSILDYAPDASPCDLAKICRKSCREVHAKRASYQSPVKQLEKVKNYYSSVHRNYEEATKVFTPQLPCKHDGPCNLHSDCSCFLNKAHCHTRCGCGKTCLRRWKGCSCARPTSKVGKVCGTKKCSCFKANIECDPEVCTTCEAKSIIEFTGVGRLSELTLPLDDKSNLCQNVSIQRGKIKQTEVRESSWGLGLFMAEPCEKGDLILEYVGELIYEPTLKSRDTVASHRKRSYVFVLNPTFCVDSAYAGNQTRYINHSPHPNCTTTVCLVNGEHRIGIYAARRINEGEELFMDYGPMFFNNKSNPSVEVEETAHLPVVTVDHSSDSTYMESQDEFTSR